jgi:hypothetical protein
MGRKTSVDRQRVSNDEACTGTIGQADVQYDEDDKGDAAVFLIRTPVSQTNSMEGGTWVADFQHPAGGDTPGVAAEPAALVGAIIVGLARSIETLSLHAAEFGVGITPKAGLMLVPPISAIGD